MCRLLGILSLNSSSFIISKYLLGDPCSLYVQSRANPSRLQSDGWGIGFYVNGSLRIIKSKKPIYEEYEKVQMVVNDLKSSIVVAHIRRASNPRGLPKERIISIENSQPFGYKNYLFAHNGVIMIPDEMANLLGDWKLKVRGLNDSEIYFWHVMKELSKGLSLPQALKSFQKNLLRVWNENREKHPDKDRPYIGLNMIFSDGEKLYAYCKYDEERDSKIKSLCYKDQLAMQMTYIVDSEKLVVASEKTNIEEDWKPLRSGQLLTGQMIDGKIKVHIEEI